MPYFALTPSDREAMLNVIGASSVDDLFADIPLHLREQAHAGFEALGHPRSEMEISRSMKALAARNVGAEDAACFLGFEQLGLIEFGQVEEAHVPALAQEARRDVAA